MIIWITVSLNIHTFYIINGQMVLRIYLAIFLIHKVVFGQEEIGYQIGETAEILSEGRLCATPHGVRVNSVCQLQ